MTIRREQPEDYEKIYTFVENAFKTAKVKDGTEQDYVDKLRASEGYLPQLALVAEEDGQIIGHIMLTKQPVVGENGEEHTILLLAPLAVALEHRSKGIGGALIEEAFRIAREMEYPGVVLLGDPAYYSRFGFCSSVDFGIRFYDDKVEAKYAQACELTPGALAHISGVFECVQ